MQRFVPAIAAGLLALVVAACSSANADQPGPRVTLSPDSPTIVAKDIAFQTKSVTAPANTAFAIDFDNEDSAPHNVDIHDASGRTVFRGDVFGGAAHRVYSVAALAAGTYTFTCDVHPDMTGTLIVR